MLAPGFWDDQRVARRLAREAEGLAFKRAAVQRLYEDVQTRGLTVDRCRLHECQRLAVVGQPEKALVRITEKVF